MSLWLLKPEASIRFEDGRRFGSSPLQESLYPRERFDWAGVTIEKVAFYHIHGRLLSKHRYRDNMGDLIPWDFAIGWEEMSDQAILDKVVVRQSDRHYYITTQLKEPSIARLLETSANVHIIPCSAETREKLRLLRVGDELELHGWLVNVFKEAVELKTSLSRTDSGDGACEILLLP